MRAWNLQKLLEKAGKGRGKVLVCAESIQGTTSVSSSPHTVNSARHMMKRIHYALCASQLTVPRPPSPPYRYHCVRVLYGGAGAIRWGPESAGPAEGGRRPGVTRGCAGAAAGKKESLVFKPRSPKVILSAGRRCSPAAGR